MEVWQTSSLRRLRLGEEKDRKKKEETTGQKYNVRICYTQGGHNKKIVVSVAPLYTLSD